MTTRTAAHPTQAGGLAGKTEDLMELQGKPDFEEALHRIEAWFNQEKLDRPPVRFAQTNANAISVPDFGGRTWPNLKARWFDAEFQVDFFMKSVRNRRFYGETFPVFWPNLGPNVYAAFHGCELEYAEITSWVQHCVHTWDDLDRIKFSTDNEYYCGIENLTRVALDKCAGKFMVGYTDLHGSLDCVADWRDPQQLCIDIVDNPERVHEMLRLANEHFFPVFDHYDEVLKAHGQLSVTWMEIPSRGTLHISSCDFTSMTSPETFCEFYLPTLQKEVAHMTHNIFHVDGRGVLNHIDHLLNVPQIQAYQWVQGIGDDFPILQWIPVIKKIQAAGKGVLVDVQLGELEPFIDAMKPDGLFLCIPAEESLQPDILKRIEKW